MNVLLTGFGPFPGALYNPTGPLVEKLARSRRLLGPRRIAHVFRTSYDDVDRELPLLLTRYKPEVLVMFGLAGRTRHLRIETRARNALSWVARDAAGNLPSSPVIAAGADVLPMRSPAQRLLRAARSTGADAQLSHDAGRYLCNYLCWRATEAAARPGGPRLAAFVHVPRTRNRDARAALTFDDLVCAGEAIVLAAVGAVRMMR
jgi:pyroglutamyl-peptidase